jgi:hypothetical protein
MYAGVPSTAPVTVTRASTDASGEIAAGVVCGPRCARPKSLTRGRPSSPTSTFSGLKSRWTTPLWWASTSPRPAARNTSSTSGRERGCFPSQWRRVVPSTSSITKKTRSLNRPTS